MTYYEERLDAHRRARHYSNVEGRAATCPPQRVANPRKQRPIAATQQENIKGALSAELLFTFCCCGICTLNLEPRLLLDSTGQVPRFAQHDYFFGLSPSCSER